MAKQADQALQRRYQFFRDQHNREWGCVVEIATGHPLGAWSPRFATPLRPDAQYLKIDDRRPGRLLIDYAAWIHDRKEAMKAYTAKCKKYCFGKYGSLFDPSRLFDPSAQWYEDVREFAGPPPKPVEPVLAAKAGNRWVLGLLGPSGEIPVMPEKLAQYFVKPGLEEQEFADEFADDAAFVEDAEDPPAPTMTEVIYATKREVVAKRKPGRPRTNPLPESEQSDHAE